MLETDNPVKLFVKAFVSTFPAVYLLAASLEGYPLFDGRTVKPLSPKNH
jgi:hypothetical protein